MSNDERIHYYMYLKITIYIRAFWSAQKGEGWSNERLYYQICYTLGHEFFIHGYRKVIRAMKAWKENDWVSYKKEMNRDTGTGGSKDHCDYVYAVKKRKNVYKSKPSMKLMMDFRDSLHRIIGDKEMYEKVIDWHDEYYFETCKL